MDFYLVKVGVLADSSRVDPNPCKVGVLKNERAEAQGALAPPKKGGVQCMVQ